MVKAAGHQEHQGKVAGGFAQYLQGSNSSPTSHHLPQLLASLQSQNQQKTTSGIVPASSMMDQFHTFGS